MPYGHLKHTVLVSVLATTTGFEAVSATGKMELMGEGVAGSRLRNLN